MIQARDVEPDDLTDEEWDRMEPFMPKGAQRGRKSTTDVREVFAAWLALRGRRNVIR